MKNIFSSIPETMEEELVVDLLRHKNVRIERILSKGQSSPENGWYEQEEHEWVLVLGGCAIISFEDGIEVKLGKGDYVNIPAHTKHRVTWTDPNKVTVWLAIFYN